MTHEQQEKIRYYVECAQKGDSAEFVTRLIVAEFEPASHDTNKESKDHRDVTVTLSREEADWVLVALPTGVSDCGDESCRETGCLTIRKVRAAALQPTSPQQEGN